MRGFWAIHLLLAANMLCANAWASDKPAKDHQAKDSLAESCAATNEVMQAQRERIKTKDQAEAKKTHDPKSSTQQPIPAHKKHFIESAGIYLNKCMSDDEKRVKALYEVAKIHYDYNHFELAVSGFDALIDAYPKSELASYAAQLVLDTLNMQKDWEGLSRYARKYQRNKKLMDNKALRSLVAVLAPQIAFKQAEALEDRLRKSAKGGKQLSEEAIQEQVAKAYMEFSQAYPKHPLTAIALYNAGIKYEQANRYDTAALVYAQIVAEFPDSEPFPRAMLKLAETYLRAKKLTKAAELYRRYLSNYKKAQASGSTGAWSRRGQKRAEDALRSLEGSLK